MIKLTTDISIKQGVTLNRDIREYVERRPKVMCKGLNGRPVFLTKYLVTTKGRLDKNRRRQRFFAGLDLLRKIRWEDTTDQIQEPLGNASFEFKGITPKGETVGVHVREETEGKNRRLYLISTF